MNFMSIFYILSAFKRGLDLYCTKLFHFTHKIFIRQVISGKLNYILLFNKIHTSVSRHTMYLYNLTVWACLIYFMPIFLETELAVNSTFIASDLCKWRTLIYGIYTTVLNHLCPSKRGLPLDLKDCFRNCNKISESKICH